MRRIVLKFCTICNKKDRVHQHNVCIVCNGVPSVKPRVTE